MLLRTFPPQVEQLARQWRAEVLTPWAWRRVSAPVPGAESRPFWVHSARGDRGLAKPGTHEPPVREHPRAAHEKIVVDLAFDLGLPVPPVTLWERPVGSRSPKYVSISALAFPRPLILCFLWEKETRWKREEGSAPFPNGVAVRRGVMEEALRCIERFPADGLYEVVGRIPGPFLSESQRHILLEGLLYRQSTVRKMMAVYLEHP